MIPLAAIILCLLSASSANARLGETIEECDARYGKPISNGDARTYLVVDGTIKVSCGFLNEKCVIIEFSKTNGDTLTEEEVSQFLSKNSQNNNFQEVSDTNGMVMYLEAGSERLAFFQKGFTQSKKFPRGTLRILGKEPASHMKKEVEERKEQLDKL